MIVGSGVTINNVDCYVGADAFIVGSHFKKHGKYVKSITITIYWNGFNIDYISLLFPGGKMP